MSSTPNYITPQGLQKLKDEYHQLFHVERPQLVETVAWAAGNGDRSENGDYIYGKKRLREIDRRLRFLGKRIDAAQVVDPTTIRSERVVFGASVTVLNEDDVQHTYRIVGEDEINVELGHISWKSPMARALLGKELGDEAVIRRPKGDTTVEIVKIAFVAS